MSLAKLYVAFYRPREGNYQHWALYLKTDEQHLLFEVTGSHPDFKRHNVETDPTTSQNFIRMEFLDYVGSKQIASVQEVAETTEIDNETVEWACQEYVLDMLENLEKEFIVDEDEETYKEAKRYLKSKRGGSV